MPRPRRALHTGAALAVLTAASCAFATPDSSQVGIGIELVGLDGEVFTYLPTERLDLTQETDADRIEAEGAAIARAQRYNTATTR